MRFPVKTIAQLECCLEKLTTRVNNGDPSDAISDAIASEVIPVDAAGNPPTGVEFNALVTIVATLRDDVNAAISVLNVALQALRDQNIIES